MRLVERFPVVEIACKDEKSVVCKKNGLEAIGQKQEPHQGLHGKSIGFETGKVDVYENVYVFC